MLVTLVVVFALCWLPLHLFTLILDLAPHLLDKIKTQSDERLFLGVYYFCHWLAMANSFANPIIYCFLNDSFRVRESINRRLFRQQILLASAALFASLKTILQYARVFVAKIALWGPDVFNQGKRAVHVSNTSLFCPMSVGISWIIDLP